MRIIVDKLPDEIIESEEVLVPTFEIAANPQVRLSEIKARRFRIIDDVNKPRCSQCGGVFDIDSYNCCPEYREIVEWE